MLIKSKTRQVPHRNLRGVLPRRARESRLAHHGWRSSRKHNVTVGRFLRVSRATAHDVTRSHDVACPCAREASRVPALRRGANAATSWSHARKPPINARARGGVLRCLRRPSSRGGTRDADAWARLSVLGRWLPIPSRSMAPDKKRRHISRRSQLRVAKADLVEVPKRSGPRVVRVGDKPNVARPRLSFLREPRRLRDEQPCITRTQDHARVACKEKRCARAHAHRREVAPKRVVALHF